jgi:hypothetical protein
MAAKSLLLQPKPARDREVRHEKPTAKHESGGTRDGRTKLTANVVPTLEAKEGGKEREGALKTGDQE